MLPPARTRAPGLMAKKEGASDYGISGGDSLVIVSSASGLPMLGVRCTASSYNQLNSVND